MHVSNYCSEKNNRFLMKEDVGWDGSASFANKSFGFVVMVVSRVDLALNTLIYLVLKFSCNLYLSYMVCLY